jgi:hypothetical protein
MSYRNVPWMVVPLFVSGVLGIAGIAWLPASERPEAVDDEAVAAFMRAKLASSQKVLEGLVTKDFELIQAGADEMHHMSEAAEWRSIHDPVYEHYSTEFRRLTEKLSRLAEDHNSEGAAFTYLHITTTCISCHEYVRDVVHVATDDAPDAPTPRVAPPHVRRQPNRR